MQRGYLCVFWHCFYWLAESVFGALSRPVDGLCVGCVFILENLPCDEPTGYGGYAPLIAAEMVLEWDFFFLLCGGDCSSVNLPAG